MKLKKKDFNSTEKQDRLIEKAEEFSAYLRKLTQWSMLTDIKYNIGISTIRFDVHFEPGTKLARYTTTAKAWKSCFDSFFDTNSSSLHQDGDKIVIEVPNPDKIILHYDKAVEALKKVPKEEGKIQAYIGESTKGDPMIIDLAELPHLLIAGETGSGKSVNLHSILISLLGRYSEDELQIQIYDTKKTGFGLYKDAGIKQITEHVTELGEVEYALSSLQEEMRRRNAIISEVKKQDLIAYNKKYPDKKIPYIVAIIDEYADMIKNCKYKGVEDMIVNLASEARGAGIFLILCTQRPDTQTLNSTAREQLVGRICFRVASKITSKMVIKTPSAENLQGSGDGYFLGKFDVPVRFQGPLLEDDEIIRVIERITA